MHLSTLIYAFTTISLAQAVDFGGWMLPACADACYKDVPGQPGLSKCKPDNMLCLCTGYTILGAMQDCLARSNDCGNGKERTDTIYSIQAVCDAVLADAAAAAQPSRTGSAAPSATGDGDDPVANNDPSVTTLPEPTSLAEAEGRLGPSASALINQRPFELSAGQKAGIAIGSIAGFLILASIGFCCGIYHYKNHVIKKMNKDIDNESPAAPEYTADSTDKGTYSSWFSNSTGFIKTHTRGATNDTHELGYGFDKELGLMISAPSYSRKYPTTKVRTVDTPMGEQTMPMAPPQVVFPHRNPVVASQTNNHTRKMSLGSVYAAQKPTLTVTQTTAIFPQATVDGTSPRSSMRLSVQSFAQQPVPNGSETNIPLMFFTPATPQVNISPVSPSSTNGNGDIFGYYSRGSNSPDNTTTIGVAKTSLDQGMPSSPEPYDPINNDVYARAPSPYTVTVSPASPYSTYAAAVEPRIATPSFDISTEPSSRSSTPSQMPQPGTGLHMPPRYTPYNSTVERAASPPLPPLPTPSPQVKQPVDRSTTPTPIGRSNSNKWRLSVERAADKALDKVRSAATAITATSTSSSGFEHVPEEEEALAKSELLNTLEDSRGRRKNKTVPQMRRADSASQASRTEPRSGSIGQSRSPSGRRTSNATGGGYGRRSSSLGRYRNRAGSLSYNQIDGVNVPRGPRGNRRGSNSSSVMLV
ncbi:hypothetical protein DRE_00278 [Drechslerella stenobrocha 248]|uniref:CFEM domain-containing protein n=1 Tax=Drechslerella stenobrocha 248 TaxID=1043628 RepID=W7IA09_9PEZI|nr:hypothetical protein DRE_00278 [Drechslerella stenobrocha 248]